MLHCTCGPLTALTPRPRARAQNEDAQNPFLQQVLDILYKTDDADEFVTPDEQHQLEGAAAVTVG